MPERRALIADPIKWSTRDEDTLFAEMDAIADAMPASRTFSVDLWFRFRELQHCDRPELTLEQSRRWFERWGRHYQRALTDRAAAADAKAHALAVEHCGLLAQRPFLTPGPERAAVEARLWALDNETANLFE